MIINDFYPTDTDAGAQLGFEYTKPISQIPVPDTFTNAYWVGWCTPDKLPDIHKLSKIDITDSAVSAEPNAPVANHDIGYVSRLAGSWVGTTYSSIIYYNGALNGWVNNGGGYGDRLDDLDRFTNNIKIYSVGSTAIEIYVTAVSTADGSVEIRNTQSLHIDFENYDDLLNKIENAVVSFGGIQYFPETFDVDLKYFNGENFSYRIETDTVTATAYISGFLLHPGRDIGVLGLGGYSNIVPIISNPVADNKFYTMGIGQVANPGQYDVGMSIRTQRTPTGIDVNTNASTMPCTPLGGVSGYVCGNMKFTYDRKTIDYYCDSQSSENVQFSIFNGNSVLFKTNAYDGYCYIGRCFQIADIIKTIPLSPRMYFPSTYGTGSNVSFPLFSDTNELTGEMISGVGIDDQLRPWQRENISENNYTENDKPEYVPDETLRDAEGDDLDLFPDYSQAFGTSMNTLLVTSGAGIDELKKILSATTDDFWKSISINGVSETNAITNYITSVKYFPFNITSYAVPLQITAITFGFNANAKIPISGSLQSGFYKMMQNYVTIDFGTVSAPCIYGERTFLDFEPYTTVDVYIPFCGIYKLSPNDVMGKTLYLTEIVDLHNGMLTAKLSTVMDGLHVELITATGNCSSNIPISGNDYVTQGDLMASAYIQGEKTFLNMAKSAVGAISANPMAIANGALNMVGNAYDVIGSLNAQTASQRDVPKQITSGSGFGNFLVTKQAYISIKRPRLQNPPNYGHVVGYSCNRDAVLETLTGYTVCRNVDTSGLTCTEHEKQMIREYLESGVYL